MTIDDLLKYLFVAGASFVTSLMTARTRFREIENRRDRDVERMDLQRTADKKEVADGLQSVRDEMGRNHAVVCSDQERAAKQVRILLRRQRKVSEQQIIILQILSDVAGKQGITHRALGTDALLRAMNDDTHEHKG